MSQPTFFFNDKLAQLEHLEPTRQLDLVYEWVKTGHIDKAVFKGLIGRIHSQNFQPNLNLHGEFKPAELS
jgi:hypothetical protein